MRRIEIITPQHVPITYQLASVRERAFAFIIDMIILGTTEGILYGIITSSDSDLTTKTAVISLVNFPLFIFYSLGFEVLLGGQTPGKKALQIRVIKLSGSELSLTDYLLRWAFRWIDIWGSLGSAAALQISSSVKGQRLGDLLADTSVVRLQTDFKVNLDDLLAIKDTSKHEIQYPEVIRMTEPEMLQVKMALDQARKYQNQAHLQVLNEISETLCIRLDIKQLESNSSSFLSRLLTDYVTVTRSE
jgi:uncharacterized RDD family membrane protein YckC